MSDLIGLPPKQGLYDPKNEHDACGIGFVVHIKGQKSNKIITQALEVLCNLDHRGARGSEPETGDGAGILMQIPHRFFQSACEGIGIDLPWPGKYAFHYDKDHIIKRSRLEGLEGVIFKKPVDPERLCAKILEVIERA